MPSGPHLPQDVLPQDVQPQDVLHRDLLHFEDIEPCVLHAGPIPVTREAIIAFATAYDPQPFHLDEAAGAASLLGGLAASGWHTTALGMRLYFEAFVGRIASMGAPGVDEVRWLRPVRPGDTLSLVLTIAGKRPSASRPDRGFVETHLDLRNAADESVMTQRNVVMVQTRGSRQQGHPVSTTFPPAGAVPLETDPMLASPYDAVAIDHESLLGTQLFTADAITDFAACYDPQSFHLDAEAARATHFGGLIASGWQTAAYWMKHYIAARARAREARAAAGLPVTVGGPSPGFSAMKWLRPVRAGETITYRLAIKAKRPLRVGWGLVTTTGTGHAADGALAFSFEGRLLWPTGTDG